MSRGYERRESKLMGRTYDVLTMGRSSIDLYAHQIGVPMAEVTSFDAYVGGCPTNISVGTRRLGLHFVLKPGWHVYWRYPGDAGAAPQVAVFAGGSQTPAPSTVRRCGPMSR